MLVCRILVSVQQVWSQDALSWHERVGEGGVYQTLAKISWA